MPRRHDDGPSRVGTDDGDSPESLAEFQRRGPSAGPVVFRQGPGDPDGVAARRGRGPGARHGEVPGAGAAAGLEAPGLVHLPVFQPAGRAVQAPLGHAAPGRLAEPAPGAAGVPAAAGRRGPAPAGAGTARPRAIRDDSGAGQPPYPFEPELGIIGLGPPRPSGRPAAGRPRGAPGRGPRTAACAASRWASRGPGASAGHSPRDRRAKLKSTGPARPGRPGCRRRRGAGRAKAVNRNGKRLLVYVLDVAATLAQNQVVIDLARRQRKTTGEWGPLRPWYYAPRAAHVKYDPEDRLILALLDEAQGNPLNPAGGPSSHAGAAGHGHGPGPGALPGSAAIGRPSRATAPSAASVDRRRPISRRRRGRRPSGRCGARGGSCCARTRRGWSSGWRGPAGSGCGAPRARTIRRRSAGTTASPGGSPWTSAPRPAASAGAGAARSAAATHRMDLSEPLVLLPGPVDPGRRQGRPVRRPGRHAVDPPAPLREGDHLRRAAAGPDARPHPGRDAGAAAGAGRVAQPRGDRRQAAALPDPAHARGRTGASAPTS